LSRKEKAQQPQLQQLRILQLWPESMSLQLVA
jgi:hypothetical protein